MNHQGSGLIGRIAQWSLALLGIVFIIMIYSGGEFGIDGGLYVTYLAFLISAGVALIGSAKGLTKKTLMGFGAFVVVLLIAYFMADSSVQPSWGVTENVSKWIGAGIIMTVIATIAAIGVILYGEVTRMIK